MKVLFICGGNVGRSQIAEAFFNYYSKRNQAWSCAGNDYTAERFQEDTVEIMKADYGIDLNKQKSKPFDPKMVEQSDIVITLCDQSECPNIPQARHWDIPKMGKLDRKGKKEVIELIRQRVTVLLKEIEPTNRRMQAR